MTRFVVDAPVAIQLAADDHAEVAPEHALLASASLRSEVLALMFVSVRAGERDERAAKGVLDNIRSLPIRLLGDRVLQSTAWRVARTLDWPDTYRAEYIALTTLQADVFVTLDDEVASAAATLVRVGSVDDLLEPRPDNADER